MRVKKYFLQTKKETPSDASLISHKLMIRSCMIKQTSSGIYAWLPLGLKVLKKIENIIRELAFDRLTKMSDITNVIDFLKSKKLHEFFFARGSKSAVTFRKINIFY